MSSHQPLNPLSLGTDYEQLAARFRPIFARIAEGAVARERNRVLPFEQIKWLKEAGFGAVRIPVGAAWQARAHCAGREPRSNDQSSACVM